MRKVFSILLVLYCVAAQAHDTTGIFIHQLPKTGVLLEKGWKFQAGDNPEWSKPGLDDSKWQSVTLSDYNSYIPALKNKDIGWFRLNLLIDSLVLKNQLAFQLSQLGASEVYLNGILFQQLGVIKSPSNFKSFNPANKPFLLPGYIGHNITIAIRFASHVPAKTWLFADASTKRSPLIIAINTWDNALNTYKTVLESAGIPPVSYMFLVLALLFLLLFAFFPKDKINLLFGAFCFFSLTSAILAAQLSQGSLDMSTFGLLSFVSNLNDIMQGTLMLLIIFQIVLHRITIPLLLLFCGMGIDMVLFFFFGHAFVGLALDLILRIATAVVFFYISVYAFRQRNYIIGIVALNSGIINVIGILTLYSSLDVNMFSFLAVFTLNFILITLYVSINFARKSKNLEVQLVEIRNLSHDNLKKEQEKQQILASQNEELERQVQERTIELTRSLDELKATQAQLIQSEKMASLGELTAGIAHEIQNPLNFVNNFSESNVELLSELKQEADEGNLEEVKAIASDVIENEKKINRHGKRAEGIVKNMLEHSRSSKGEKQPTDMNTLVDEYLRLAYHGFRAKDKRFNAAMQTTFDEGIGKVNIVPQEIGRVLLNLFHNAFYAVQEKKKKAGEGYEPTVTVSTRKLNNKVEIRVQDNGMGIPQQAIDKIFQPFFTTKPTGQGTGLGLSLSYDIVRAHGGELKVESTEREGATFIVSLPI